MTRRSNFLVRILVIEDEAAIAANVCDFLESRGHVVDAAADGGTGAHLAVTAAFDAIVLDRGLPRIDGLALYRRLREDAGRDTPVLVLTARDTLEDKLEGFGAGAADPVENLHGVGHRRAAAAARCEMARAQRRVDPGCRRVRHRARDRETHGRSLRLEDRGRKRARPRRDRSYPSGLRALAGEGRFAQRFSRQFDCLSTINSQ